MASLERGSGGSGGSIIYYLFSWFSSDLLRQLFDKLPEKKESEVARSCPTLCNPMDCSLPGFYVHGIFQASVLEWVAISFSRGSSHPRNWTQVSHTVGRCFTLWATREVQKWYRWSYLQNRNRDRDMKRHMDTEEKGVVVGWPGGSALTYVHY